MKIKKIKRILIGMSCLLIASSIGSIAVSFKLLEVKDDRARLEVQLEENNNKVLELETSIEELNKTIEDKNIEIDNINSELENKNNEINNKNNEIDSLNKKIEEVLARRVNGKEIQVELTGYCNCSICSDSWGSKTALGTKTRTGVIAAPKEIKLGSKLIIDDLKWYKGDSTFTVEDRGGAVIRKSNGAYVIDVWFPTHEQALKLGRVKTTARLVN